MYLGKGCTNASVNGVHLGVCLQRLVQNDLAANLEFTGTETSAKMSLDSCQMSWRHTSDAVGIPAGRQGQYRFEMGKETWSGWVGMRHIVSVHHRWQAHNPILEKHDINYRVGIRRGNPMWENGKGNNIRKSQLCCIIGASTHGWVWLLFLCYLDQPGKGWLSGHGLLVTYGLLVLLFSLVHA